jgi:hypothetical protein
VSMNHITRSSASPTPDGPSATIVFGDRYVFGTARADTFLQFNDGCYSRQAVFYHPSRSSMPTNNSREESLKAYLLAAKTNQMDMAEDRVIFEKWRQATNLLTLEKAQAVAESAMRTFGLSLKKLRFSKPTKREQMVWREDYEGALETNKDGIFIVQKPVAHPFSYALPYYEFEWSNANGNCEVEVSGILGTVVHFHFYGYGKRSPKPSELRDIMPKNYLELLGLRPDIVFVKERWRKPLVYEIYPSRREN